MTTPMCEGLNPGMTIFAVGGEKMKSNSKSLCGMRSLVSLAFVFAFVMASQHVAAINRLAGIVGGKTEVTSAGACGSGTWIIAVPAILDVNNGDNVYVDCRAWWWDNRSASSTPLAYHNYSLDVDYMGTTYSNSYSRQTTGSESGRNTFSVYVYNVQQGNYLFINWTAKVSGPTDRTCPSNSVGPMQTVYLG